MGSEMGYNLFSKSLVDGTHTNFVVCDALPAAADTFKQRFLSQFPKARMHIATTPEEFVLRFTQLG
jgi:3-hydroxyisobutyrate dehydrogenase